MSMQAAHAEAHSQEQIQQKQQDLNLVLRALANDSLVSAGVEERQMIIQGLPHALSNAHDSHGQRHEFQRRFASLARDVLADMSHAARETTDAAKNNVEKTRQASIVAEQEVNIAASAVEAARQEASSRAKVVEEAEAARKDAEREEADAQKGKNTILETMDQLRNEHAKATSLYEGPYRMLREGGWGDEDMRTESCEAVNEHLESRGGLEAALLAAAPVALQTHPTDRKCFDNAVIDSVGAVFEKDATVATDKLAEGSPAESQASAEALGFWALADILRERAQSRAAERAEAEKAVADAEKTHHAAKCHAADLEAAQSACATECGACEARQSEMVAALEALDRLVAGNYLEAAAAPTPQPDASLAPSPSLALDKAGDVEMEDATSDIAQPPSHCEITSKVMANAEGMDVDMRQLGA